VYDFWVFVHMAGVLGFLAGHGVSAAVGLRLRSERDRSRIRALLDLSAGARAFTYGSLLVLLAGGVVAGFRGHWWGQGWIWAAVGLLVALTVATIPIAVPYYRRVRASVDGATDRELDELLSAPHAVILAVLGTVVILAILWLMVFKPF
jgi:Predicted integral membrane protein (DUF2269)